MATPNYFNFPSFLLSRFAFLGTHVVFLYWLSFLLNDPLNLGTNTLDFKQPAPPGTQCRRLIPENVSHDLMLFALWWGTHSLFARKAYKQAIGLWNHPLERPLFATIATIMWGINVIFWKPISDCSRWNPLTVPPQIWAASGTVILFAILLVVGFLWYLPDHVFGTGRYSHPPGSPPKHGIITGFPYGLVRHPAATGFLWAYWALPAYTENHIFLASLWTIFILVGTLVFEEGGLKGEDEFGKKYLQYKNEVWAFVPNVNYLKSVVGLGSPAKKD
jgi:protein-S-isoprenylcysteine O-methyltransferase Ste14